MRNAVVLVPIAVFGPHIRKANVLLSGHVKDAPYVALALAMGAPFWTNENFSRRVPTITTEELRKIRC
jgi:predicted nucleic acid-binding protein